MGLLKSIKIRFDQFPVFWRFQVLGWAVFALFSFPLKLVLLESIPGSILISIYRDGLGFLLTIGMREIYRRIDFANTPPMLIVVAAAGVSFIGGGLLTAFSLVFHATLDFEEEKIFSESVIFATFYFRTGLCAGWSLLYFAIKLARERTRRELAFARSEAARERAELQMLRAQMNPHFILNALNTITASIGRDRCNTQGLVRALADYLKFSLKNRANDLVPLNEELEAVQGFLDVESARFPGEWIIEISVAVHASNDLVPGIFLQPLIENAIKYGKHTSAKPRRLILRASHSQTGSLVVEVKNSGRWIPHVESKDSINGNGLSNLRQRLDALYPGTHGFAIHAYDGWVTVRIEVPKL